MTRARVVIVEDFLATAPLLMQLFSSQRCLTTKDLICRFVLMCVEQASRLDLDNVDIVNIMRKKFCERRCSSASLNICHL